MKTSIFYIKRTVKFLFLSLITIVSVVILGEFIQVKSKLPRKIAPVFDSSVKEYVKSTSINTPYTYTQQKQNENKIGEYETRTLKLPDTTFIFQSKVVDVKAEIFRGAQIILFMTDQLQPEPIQLIFDSLLHENGIRYTQSSIGITSSFYKETNEWSKDTTSLATNDRFTLANEEEFNLINYHAHVDYSLLTYWQLCHKAVIYILLLLCCATGGFLLYQFIEKKIGNRKGILRISKTIYRLQDTIIDLRERKIYTEDKEIMLGRQKIELATLFLVDNETHRVLKKNIREQFWPGSNNSINNMSTSIRRLREVLEEINCGYTIATDPEAEEYYVLIKTEKLLLLEEKARKEQEESSLPLDPSSETA